MITFAEQAALFLDRAQKRKRNPVRESTVKVYRAAIKNHLNPKLGNLSLDVVGNAVVKVLVAEWAAAGMSPAQIVLNLGIIKQIRASAVNENGEELFPYTWNNEFMDIPSIGDQHQPVADAHTVTTLVKKARKDVSALVAVLAGSGVRIAEALAITGGWDDGASNFWDGEKIIVRAQRSGDTLLPVKTAAGEREVDLAPKLNDYLKRVIVGESGEPLTGYMFPLEGGTYRTQLVDEGYKGGFHSFRRFRATHLRMHGTPDPLVKFWLGHEDETVTDRYTKVGAEIEARRDEAARVGLGFKLPEGK